MTKNSEKEDFISMPTEKYYTAQWANVANMKPITNIVIPSEVKETNAKELVDNNEK